ncbi:MAG: hypothetical protein PHI71_14250 [Acidiphilium sp.]|nr:hypothetical protein [Acidiphilium sp.]
MRKQKYAPWEYYVFAFLFNDGTAWIGQTQQPKKYPNAIQKIFGESCQVVLLEQFHTYLEYPGRAEVYQWRYRFSQEGVRIRVQSEERTYTVSLDMLNDDLRARAGNLVLDQKIKAWLAATRKRHLKKQPSPSKIARLNRRAKENSRRLARENARRFADEKQGPRGEGGGAGLWPRP